MNVSERAVPERWDWFFQRWGEKKLMLGVLFFWTVLSVSVSVGYPIFFKYVIDEITAGLESGVKIEGMTRHVLGVLLILGALKFVSCWYPFLRAAMSAVFEKEIQGEYFGQILLKGNDFFQSFRSGDLLTRLTDDVGEFPRISWFISSGIFRAVNSTGIVVFCFAAMVWLDPVLALLTILPLPFLLWMYLKISGKMRKAYTELQQQISKTNDQLESSFSGAQVLKANNAEKSSISTFENILEDRYGKEMTTVRLHGKLHVFFEFSGYACQVIVVLVGGYFVINTSMSLGDYYAFFSYLGMIIYPLLDIPTLFVTSRQAFACVDRLEEMRESPNESQGGDRHLPNIEKLEVKSLKFSYPSKEEVLSDISFSLEKGERLAVVGQIGSGKSTLIKLLSGLLGPSDGSILINSVAIEQYSLASYREKLGYIPQEPLVFSESVQSNIDFFRGLEEAEIHTAAKVSCLEKEISLFTDGYEQQIGQRGMTLSGGQKQRMTIARALCGKPELVLMDDITASLDAHNEEKFWEYYENYFLNTACVVVTHRMATAKRCSKVLVLDENGKQVGLDTFSKLQSDNKIFRKIMQMDT